MRKYIDFFKNTFKLHPYLFIANLISIVFGGLQFIYCVFVFDNSENKLIGFIFLFPIFLMLVISSLVIKFFKLCPWFFKIFSFVFNVAFLFMVQIIMAGFILAFVELGDISITENNIQNYEHTISYKHSTRTAHFPRKIPEQATDVNLEIENCVFFGSERIYLKFKADRAYIDNEIKKYSYVNTMKDGKCSSECKYSYNFYTNKIDLDGLTFYIINDREHEDLPGHHFPYHYGIGVNYDTNEILYYYECPD